MAGFDEPRVSISMSRKLNMGQYESCEVTLHLTQIPYNANATLIEQMLKTSELAAGMMMPELRERLRDIVRTHESGVDLKTLVTGYEQSARDAVAQSPAPAQVQESAPKAKKKPSAESVPPPPPSPVADTAAAAPITSSTTTNKVLEGPELSKALEQVVSEGIPAPRTSFDFTPGRWPDDIKFSEPATEKQAQNIAAELAKHSIHPDDAKLLCNVVMGGYGIVGDRVGTKGAASLLWDWLMNAQEASWDKALAVVESLKQNCEVDPFGPHASTKKAVAEGQPISGKEVAA